MGDRGQGGVGVGTGWWVLYNESSYNIMPNRRRRVLHLVIISFN